MVEFYISAKELIVDWGDETTTTYTAIEKGAISHKYIDNNLRTIQIVSNKMTQFGEIGDNRIRGTLEKLNFGDCPNLTKISVTSNCLSEVDISKASALEEIRLSGNRLAFLDVSNNTKLKELYCSNNQLIYFNIDKNTELETLYCEDNQLINLDIGKNIKLKELSCGGNQLIYFNIRKNTELETLYRDGNQTSSDVPKNIKLISLIFPGTLINKEWRHDKKMLMLSLIGLTPVLLSRLAFTSFLTFYSIALYFSMIWGLFFFYLFKTPQVKTKTAIGLFFMLQLFVFIVWDILNLPSWYGINQLYAYTKTNSFILRLTGYIFGVGVIEETVKAIPLLLILRNAKEPYIPLSLVFYGLMSGIAFGVFEGVQYQMTENIKLDYSTAFFMNIARLTILPFLHAIWTGIAGYFIVSANMYHKYRFVLYFMAIFVPAVIHGLYDALGWSSLGMLFILLSVMLLMSYLKQSANYETKM
jgi:RsiW-degrading membrane proteinase PrsW (M82 family)